MCQWAPGGQVTSNNNYYDNIGTKKDSFQEHVFILHTVYSVETYSIIRCNIVHNEDSLHPYEKVRSEHTLPDSSKSFHLLAAEYPK